MRLESEQDMKDALHKFLLHNADFAVCQWDDDTQLWIPIPFKAALREAETWAESQEDDYTE